MFALIPDGCSEYLLAVGVSAALLGAIVAGIAAYLVWVKRTPAPNYNNKVISNGEALDLIQNHRNYMTQNCQQTNNITNSGHLELDVLLEYIDKMKVKCKAVGKDMTGLEYYFARYSDDVIYGPDVDRPTIVLYPTFLGKDEQDNDAHIPFDPFLEFENGPITVARMNGIETAQRKGGPHDGWYTSHNVLNRTNMSPPREPLTL